MHKWAALISSDSNWFVHERNCCQLREHLCYGRQSCCYFALNFRSEWTCAAGISINSSRNFPTQTKSKCVCVCKQKCGVLLHCVNSRNDFSIEKANNSASETIKMAYGAPQCAQHLPPIGTPTLRQTFGQLLSFLQTQSRFPLVRTLQFVAHAEYLWCAAAD